MKRRLSVLILSPHPQTQGGVSAYVEMLKAYIPNCDVHSFWVGKPVGRDEMAVGALWRLVAAPFQVIKLVKVVQPDIIHLNPSFDRKALLRDGLIMLFLRLAEREKIFLFCHGWDEALCESIISNCVAKVFLRFVLARSSRIAVLSPRFEAQLQDLGITADKVVVAKTMVAPELFQLSLSPNERKILFLSRFDRRKGCHELLDAFASIASSYPDWKLVLAGDGVERDSLKKKTADYGLTDRVEFPGYISGAAKMAALAACSLFALPTYYPEGMPIALLEAMAAGKPVLTANAGGIDQVVRNDVGGVVLDEVNVQNVAAALTRMMNDHEFCQSCGMANRPAARDYSAPIVAAEIYAVYKDVVEESAQHVR